MCPPSKEPALTRDGFVRVPSLAARTDRAWNPRHNGVKRQQEGDSTGYFGAINLLGPRSPTQRPLDKLWYSTFTGAQFRFDFLREPQPGSYAASGVNGLSPLTLQRLFFTFWDVDTGQPTFANSAQQVEAMQMGPQAVLAERGVGDDGASDLRFTQTWHEIFAEQPPSAIGDAVADASVRLAGWDMWRQTNPQGGSGVFSGTSYGIGEYSTYTAYDSPGTPMGQAWQSPANVA